MMRWFERLVLSLLIGSFTMSRAEVDATEDHVFVSTYLPAEFDGAPVASALLPDGSALIAVNRTVEEETNAIILLMSPEGRNLRLWEEIPGQVNDMELRGNSLFVTGSAGTRSLLTRPVAPERIWTNREGREVHGTLENITPETVSLLINGRRAQVPIATLSDEDQIYLQHEVLMPRIWRGSGGWWSLRLSGASRSPGLWRISRRRRIYRGVESGFFPALRVQFNHWRRNHSLECLPPRGSGHRHHLPGNRRSSADWHPESFG